MFSLDSRKETHAGPLCKSDVESTSHLFFKCPATKLFWFGLSWGIGPDSIPITTDMDIVNLVVHPPIGPGTPSELKKFSFHASCQIALTMECIWQ
jgi:hypothetical protein